MNPENHQKKLFQEFESADLETWKEAALKMLKGKALETLQHLSYENIEIAPIYTADQGIQTHSLTQPPNTWLNQVPLGVDPHAIEDVNKLAISAIQNGAEAIRFFIEAEEGFDFNALLNQIHQSEVALTFNFIPQSVQYFDALKSLDFKGNVFFDFLSYWVFTGDLEDSFWNKLIEINQTFITEKNQTIEVGTIPFHLRGVSATQELAIALSMAVEYLDHLSQKGLSINHIFPKVAFNLGISGDYFVEIAKFRAMRILWDQIAKAYQIEQTPCFIQANTGLWNKYPEDEYNNILRTTTEALSAVVGNCDVLWIRGFKENPYLYPPKQFNELSVRIARNISSILKYESHLNKVTDPGHGSYYIEYLTQKIAEKAWSIFQEIEKEGGFIQAFKSEFIVSLVDQVTKERKQDMDSGKAVFVGVNKYQNPKDEAK